MIKAVLLAAGAALLAAVPAHAEKWMYYPIPGGAMAYDVDSRHADVASGNAVGDTLVYYFIPRAAGTEAYSFLIRRMEFQCRSDKFRAIGTAFFDENGKPLAQSDEEENWDTVRPNTPSAVFKRIICNNDKPPTAKEAPTKDELVPILRALPMTTEKKSAAPASAPVTPEKKPATPAPAAPAAEKKPAPTPAN